MVDTYDDSAKGMQNVKPRATFHWLWLLFWCIVGALLWLAAVAVLRALGLAPWQVLVFLALVAGAGMVWMVGN